MSSETRSNSTVMQMGCGCLPWIIGVTGIAWWLGGAEWARNALGLSLLVALVFAMLAVVQSRMVREVDESREQYQGTMKCPTCSGNGWVREDHYNEVTCTQCNGSGWADAPRQGPPRMRGV